MARKICEEVYYARYDFYFPGLNPWHSHCSNPKWNNESVFLRVYTFQETDSLLHLYVLYHNTQFILIDNETNIGELTLKSLAGPWLAYFMLPCTVVSLEQGSFCH